MIKESTLNEFLYSTDKAKLDILYIHEFLKKSYWAKEIPEAVMKISIENSLCVGIYHSNQQVGFARLITDYATFAYLGDVFVDEKYRGRGASKGLMQFILSFEFINGLRRIMLVTRDAQGLYNQFGFRLLQRPERYMEIHHQDVYLNKELYPETSSL
ncbi:MAG TPA: GNAT family N-acetyltransferase [Cyclobacteriaceae bacterium]